MCSLNPSCYNGLWICMCRFHYDEISFMQNYSKLIWDYCTVAKWHYPLSVSTIFLSVISVNNSKEHSLKKNGFDKHMLYQTERWMKREGGCDASMCSPSCLSEDASYSTVSIFTSFWSGSRKCIIPITQELVWQLWQKHLSYDCSRSIGLVWERGVWILHFAQSHRHDGTCCHKRLPFNL